MKSLCKFAVFSAMFALAVMMSSCQSSKVEECASEQTPPQLVPQEIKKEAAGPAKKVEAPAKKAEAPAKKAEAPAKKVETPAKKAEAPAKKVEVPAKKEEAPAVKKKAAPVRKAAVKLPCKHTVRSSDNLWQISMRYYGKGSYWKHIYNANKKLIRKPEFLEPGTVLTIPAVKKAK